MHRPPARVSIAWRRALAALLALALQAGAQHAPEPAPSESVAREWMIRELALGALGAGGVSDELRRALDARDWRERAAALEALARGAPASLADARAASVGLARGALADPHPSVRAAALRVLARAPRTLELAPEELAPLVHDVLPHVRLELAHYLGRRPGAAAVGVLAELAGDGDERVRAAARRRLLALTPGDALDAGTLVDAQLALVARLVEQGGLDALLDALAVLERAAPSAQLLARLRQWLERAPLDPAAARAGRVALEALSFAQHGRGDAATLVDGWRARALPRGAGVLRASGRSGDAELGRRLLRAAREAERAGESLAAPGSLALELLESALECLGPAEALREGLALELSAALAVALLERAGWRPQALDEASARAWLAGARPALVRAALVRALAYALATRGERVAARALAWALDDADAGVAEGAFRALCAAPDPALVLADLARFFAARSAAEKRELLAVLPRGVRLTGLRDELLALGEHADERRLRVAPLLASFAPDARVRAALERWLDDDLARLASAHEAELGELEPRLVALLDAVVVHAGADATGVLSRALEQSLARSIAVAVRAVFLLSRDGVGRTLLVAQLGPKAPRRVRVEAALALVAVGHPAALEVLVREHALVERELRRRVVAALARTHSELALAFLASGALSAELDSAERREMVAALAELGLAGVRPALERISLEGPDVATRCAAIAHIGRLGGREAEAWLEGLWAGHAERARAGRGFASDEVAGAESELERQELLAALVRTRWFARELERELVRRALAVGAQLQEQRFRGEPVVESPTRWRGELEIVRALAWEGRLVAALDAIGPWWRLDARLLLACGEAALESRNDDAREGAWRLFQGALVALAGEAQLDPEPLVRARAELLRLARERRDWGALEALAEELLDDWAADLIPAAVWSAAFGDFDRASGVDPRASLASARVQARAHAALARGECEHARELARAARALVGCSTTAAAEQAELEAALDRADG